MNFFFVDFGCECLHLWDNPPAIGHSCAIAPSRIDGFKCCLFENARITLQSLRAVDLQRDMSSGLKHNMTVYIRRLTVEKKLFVQNVAFPPSLRHLGNRGHHESNYDFFSSLTTAGRLVDQKNNRLSDQVRVRAIHLAVDETADAVSSLVAHHHYKAYKYWILCASDRLVVTFRTVTVIFRQINKWIWISMNYSRILHLKRRKKKTELFIIQWRCSKSIYCCDVMTRLTIICGRRSSILTNDQWNIYIYNELKNYLHKF